MGIQLQKEHRWLSPNFGAIIDSIYLPTPDRHTDYVQMAYQPTGYARLARFMAKDKKEAIFRRFEDLNFLSLLSLQAEIVELEAELRQVMQADDEAEGTTTLTDEGNKTYMRSDLSKNFKLSRDAHSQQYQILQVIRGKLKEYTLQITQLNSISSPILWPLHNLDVWLSSPYLGHPFLSGHEATTWKGMASNYMCLQSPNTEDDIFTRFLSVFLERILVYLNERFSMGELFEGGIIVSSNAVQRVSRVFTTVIASMIPVLTILVLNVLSSTTIRIVVTLAFTAVFAAAISIFTNAKRVEIFAATAT
ncbi:hypothetical protein FBEOM_2481 [Fusarium beomiforme]|uniref:DUF6594 domain-containing protein n=1 Tax=Fusarium beomiforme TaxID=44412 RepID=A0A9P5DZY2_9HYPO|nr:hypothetical protein FBEOM_2481 [Fusarium beomiforme]